MLPYTRIFLHLSARPITAHSIAMTMMCRVCEKLDAKAGGKPGTGLLQGRITAFSSANWSAAVAALRQALGEHTQEAGEHTRTSN